MVLGGKRFVTAVAMVALICGTRAWAQAPEEKISGVVRDAIGAGIPGVTVTATNQATNASQTTTTGNDGSYSFALAPGAYSVTATLAGFRRVAQTVDVPAGAAEAGRFHAGGRAERGDHRDGHEARIDGARRALLDRGAHRAGPARPRRRRHRGRGRERGRVHRAEPRTRPEPGGHARRLRGTDRARPARRERAGRRRTSTSRSSRSRCSRRTSTCSTSPAWKCCADRRGRSSAPARCRGPSATSPTSRS